MPLSTPSPARHPPSPHPPSEHLIRHLRAGSESVHLLTPRMPDIVPIVRRPVKKLNSPPIFDKRSETESLGVSGGLGRKFSLPSDKASGIAGTGSKVKRSCEGNLPVKSRAVPKKEEELPVAVSFPKYDASQFVSTKHTRNVLPELRVAEPAQRVAKTTVSLFIFLPLSCEAQPVTGLSMLVILLLKVKLSPVLRRRKARACHALPGLMVDYTLLRMVNAHISPSSAWP